MRYVRAPTTAYSRRTGPRGAGATSNVLATPTYTTAAASTMRDALAAMTAADTLTGISTMRDVLTTVRDVLAAVRDALAAVRNVLATVRSTSANAIAARIDNPLATAAAIIQA